MLQCDLCAAFGEHPDSVRGSFPRSWDMRDRVMLGFDVRVEAHVDREQVKGREAIGQSLVDQECVCEQPHGEALSCALRRGFLQIGAEGGFAAADE